MVKLSIAMVNENMYFCFTMAKEVVLAHSNKLVYQACYLKIYVFDTLLREPQHVFSLADMAVEINATPVDVRDVISVLMVQGFITNILPKSVPKGGFRIVVGENAMSVTHRDKRLCCSASVLAA